MSITTVETIESQINELTATDRAELLRRLNNPQPNVGGPKKAATNGKKGYVSPNTIWIRDHSGPYGGQYVAVENGELVATGTGYPQTLAIAIRAGAVRPMITYVPREDEQLFGGW